MNMQRCLYDLVLFLYCLVMMPKLFLERLQGKRHPAFLQRIGFNLPHPNRSKVIWIHAVSVGEVKASAPFLRILKENFPDAWICVTTTTSTGQEEAKRSLKSADAFFYLPLDFSFVVRRFVTKIKPDLFFLVESDFWPQLLEAVRKRGGKTFLISGKMSERASARWNYFPSIAGRLFSQLDCLCVQSEEYRGRFLSVGVAPAKIHITGNLKFDLEPQNAHHLPLAADLQFLTISCTHSPEEEILLDLLKNSPWTIFLAPRHPERFGEVAHLLERKNISFIRWKDLSQYRGEKVILVDVMGQLASCYSVSKLALVGGSFIPKIGGHNVLEPCLYGCPSLFGPYTFTQKELVKKVIASGSGMQKPLVSVLDAIEEILENHEEYSLRARKIIADSRGAASLTWNILHPFL